MMKAPAPMIGGVICPPVDDVASTCLNHTLGAVIPVAARQNVLARDDLQIKAAHDDGDEHKADAKRHKQQALRRTIAHGCTTR